MSAIAYVRGRYVPVAAAHVPIEDRGFQFADSIYEVVAFLNRRLVDWDKHLWRLRRNAAALFIDGLPSDAALATIAARLIRLGRVPDGLLYIQFTRGVARRDHGFPQGAEPTLVMTVRRFDYRQRIVQQRQGVAVTSLPDQRWQRCDIKSTGLLPVVLAKEEARRAGSFEAVLHTPDDVITEGASTNIWMVDAAGRLITHPLSARILPGIVRDTLLHLAKADGMEVIERPFTLSEAAAAPELFLTSTSAPILPIVRLDGAAIGDGTPGPVVARLAGLLWDEIERQTGWRG